jgi:hypothetical protein
MIGGGCRDPHSEHLVAAEQLRNGDGTLWNVANLGPITRAPHRSRP